MPSAAPRAPGNLGQVVCPFDLFVQAEGHGLLLLLDAELPTEHVAHVHIQYELQKVREGSGSHKHFAFPGTHIFLLASGHYDDLSVLFHKLRIGVTSGVHHL